MYMIMLHDGNILFRKTIIHYEEKELINLTRDTHKAYIQGIGVRHTYTAPLRNRTRHSEASKMVSIFLYVFRKSQRVFIVDRETEAKPWRLGKGPPQLPVA